MTFSVAQLTGEGGNSIETTLIHIWMDAELCFTSKLVNLLMLKTWFVINELQAWDRSDPDGIRGTKTSLSGNLELLTLTQNEWIAQTRQGSENSSRLDGGRPLRAGFYGEKQAGLCSNIHLMLKILPFFLKKDVRKDHSAAWKSFMLIVIQRDVSKTGSVTSVIRQGTL